MLFFFKVIPFGLNNAPRICHYAINIVFFDFLDKFVVIYLDDLLVFSNIVEEHHKALGTVFSYWLHLRPDQYTLLLRCVEFFRNILDDSGIHI